MVGAILHRLLIPSAVSAGLVGEDGHIMSARRQHESGVLKAM
jgi:hypothetical protein